MLPANLLLQNRYRIVRRIGQGGMGAVYEALDHRLEQRVALKQIVRGDAVAFAREARLLARLHHPALPRVTDHFVEEVGQFLVMEYVPGDDLATTLLHRQTRLPPDTVLDWADQLLATLTYLHTQAPPILHRDIKPANLKVTEQQRLILLDFGLAKDHTDLTSEPQKSAVGYTLAYAAPEQIRGEGTDACSDLYSAAATLYHLLTGSRPPDAIQRAMVIADGKPDPLFLPANPSLPPILLTILQKALALNPANRFADAATLRTALRSGLADVTQVVTAGAPPVVASVVSATSRAIPNNLPARLTSLLGREGAIEELCQRLARPDRRLVTLTGAGGSGKTTLALAVARTLVATTTPLFPDGIYFVNLAPIHDPALAPATLAQVLGVKEEAGKSRAASLQEFLRQRRLLLVLDNFEQIITAAPLISDLLTACAALKIIVTSREVLRVRGEHEFLVPLLALPMPNQQATVAELHHFAAVQLFVERTQALKPIFVLDESNAAPVAEIVTRLDGLPLAIELAASHSKLLSPQAILARLQDRFKLLRSNVRDLPDRQRTLRAAIDWSYDLLTPDEQTLFRRLAVFVGGRTLEAIEAVCNPQDHPEIPQLAIDVLDGLTALMDKSLLYQTEGSDGEPRFLMLVTIYEYAVERLVESDEHDAITQKHARYYLRLVESSELALRSTNQLWWLNRLEVEHTNFQSALQWALEQADPTLALQLGSVLWRFWEVRGYLAEGRIWLQRILQKAGGPPPLQAKVLIGVGALARAQGDYEEAIAHLEGALHLWQTLNDQIGISNALTHLGRVLSAQGQYNQAVALLEQGLALRRAVGDQRRIADSLLYIGIATKVLGNYARAQTLFEESLAIRQALADQQGIAESLESLGSLAYDQNNLDRALHFFEQCLTLRKRLGDKPNIAHSINSVGRVAHTRGDYAKARQLFTESLTLHQEMGNKHGIANALNNLGCVAADENDLPQAYHYFQQSYNYFAEQSNKYGIALTLNNLALTNRMKGNLGQAQAQYRQALLLNQELGNLQRTAEVLTGIGTVAGIQGELEKAARLFGFAEALVEQAGASLPPSDLNNYLEQKAAVRSQMGEEQFMVSWLAGQAMTLKQAIEYALYEIA
ncbi:MAG: NACHT domain-containing protein [Caldilinea sp. CFX5]|nr:NACHT domain-containing protein [Caldilinea sp. CFX5]